MALFIRAVRILIKSAILLISIPILYKIAFTIAKQFHEPNGNNGLYGLFLYMLAWVIAISIPALIFLEDTVIKKEKTTTLIHTGWFLIIVLFSLQELKYMPYEHGLLLVCIGSTIVTRIVLNKLIGPKYQFK